MLIEVEGPSGAGKTSLIKSLQAMSGAINVAEIERETPAELAWSLGEFMRKQDVPPDRLEVLFLYCARVAARARLLAVHGASDHLVLVDRFRLSLHVAALNAGLGSDVADVLIGLATHYIEPDLTVLLDVEYEVHRRRLAERGHAPMAEDEFEENRLHFKHASASMPGRRIFIDTSHVNPDEVQAAVAKHLPAPAVSG